MVRSALVRGACLNPDVDTRGSPRGLRECIRDRGRADGRSRMRPDSGANRGWLSGGRIRPTRALAQTRLKARPQLRPDPSVDSVALDHTSKPPSSPGRRSHGCSRRRDPHESSHPVPALSEKLSAGQGFALKGPRGTNPPSPDLPDSFPNREGNRLLDKPSRPATTGERLIWTIPPSVSAQISGKNRSPKGQES